MPTSSGLPRGNSLLAIAEVLTLDGFNTTSSDFSDSMQPTRITDAIAI